MKIEAKSVEEYYNNLPEERREHMNKLRQIIAKNIPKGFEEHFDYGMPGWSVPHSLYPPGYHCNSAIPLPFIGIAAQKNFISFYHMGMYADEALLQWFVEEYPKHSTTKLDMGKSCVRFKKPEHIPYELIALLVKKMNPQAWIALYEQTFKKKK